VSHGDEFITMKQSGVRGARRFRSANDLSEPWRGERYMIGLLDVDWSVAMTRCANPSTRREPPFCTLTRITRHHYTWRHLTTTVTLSFADRFTLYNAKRSKSPRRNVAKSGQQMERIERRQPHPLLTPHRPVFDSDIPTRSTRAERS